MIMDITDCTTYREFCDRISQLSAVVAHEQLHIPPGYGMRLLSPEQRRAAQSISDDDGLLDRLQIYEPPRRGKQYVIGVDVASGIGQDRSNRKNESDRSVIDVCRVGDIDEGEEQVAQFVTYDMEPTDLAYVIDPIGRFYQSITDRQPALVAIECNGFGLGVMSEIRRHVGYNNLFIWQHEDAINEQSKFSRAYGWYTSQRSRALILQRYFRGLKSVDPVTGRADYRINSPFTMRELADFKTAGALWEGEGDPHDDCIMAGAIAVHVAQTLQSEQREPLAETRRRKAEEKARAERAGMVLAQSVGWQNTDISVDELDGLEGRDFVDMLDNTREDHYR